MGGYVPHPRRHRSCAAEVTVAVPALPARVRPWLLGAALAVEAFKAELSLSPVTPQSVQMTGDEANNADVHWQLADVYEKLGQNANAKSEFDLVNARSYEYQAVKREADADKTLYAELVRKIKEAGINAGFQNSAIRIADSARAGGGDRESADCDYADTCGRHVAPTSRRVANARDHCRLEYSMQYAVGNEYSNLGGRDP